MASQTNLSFQPLNEAHFALLHQWLNEPHVKRWWDKEGCSLTQMQDKYIPRINKQVPVSCFIFAANAQPIGYIQSYWLKDFPEYSDQLGIEIAARSAAFDVFIGERSWLDRGIGTAAIKQFLAEIIFGKMQATNCIVGPDEANFAAIKAYSKAGLKHIKTVQVAGETGAEYLMEIGVMDIDDWQGKGQP